MVSLEAENISQSFYDNILDFDKRDRFWVGLGKELYSYDVRKKESAKSALADEFLGPIAGLRNNR